MDKQKPATLDECFEAAELLQAKAEEMCGNSRGDLQQVRDALAESLSNSWEDQVRMIEVQEVLYTLDRLIVEHEAQVWQPIETAPRNERILLWSGQEKYCGHWSKNPYTEHEAWIVAEWGNQGDQALIENPTHWMPLPQPPTMKGE